VSVPESDRLLVRKENLARCAWCGTPESPKWVTTQRNEIFCSPECQAAKYSSRRFNFGFLSACCGGIAFFYPIIMTLRFQQAFYLPEAAGDLFVLAFAFFILGICMMITGSLGSKYLDRKDKYRDVTLLQCEYCMQANPPSFTRCRYCGAPLTRAPFTYETMPPWIREQLIDQRPLGRFICPHCNAIYSYDASKVESDGRIRCQNCLRPFLSPYPIPQQQEPTTESYLYSDI
jgi:predicted Zn finger-like uncharacterized protein